MRDDIQLLKEAEKEANGQQSAEERRPRTGHNNNWIAGLVLVLLGLVFLAGNIWDIHLDNWWALFILIPVVVNVGNALRLYRHHGRFNRAARGMLTGAIVLSVVAAAFLFELDWGMIWPLFLIIAGLAALVNAWT
jgi:hypothetical protein